MLQHSKLPLMPAKTNAEIWTHALTNTPNLDNVMILEEDGKIPLAKLLIILKLISSEEPKKDRLVGI